LLSHASAANTKLAKKSMRTPRAAIAALALALVSGNALSQTTTHEFWPELDTWIKLDDSTRLLLATDGTRDRDSGDRVDSDVAAYVDYRFSSRISFRAGYDYSDTPPTVPGDPHRIERRCVLDTSYNWQLDDATKLTNRVRADLRDIAGSNSYRIRDRLKLQHETRIGRQPVTPYGNIEAFYDSRYDTVSRYRLEIGATTPLSKDIEIDLYVGRQRDSQPSDKYANGIGLTLNLYL
jgi:Protein of unknown function (DUF2490)